MPALDIGYVSFKKEDTIIILLCGGDQATQEKDIVKAHARNMLIWMTLDF